MVDERERKQRLELRYRVYHATLITFFVEDLVLHVRELFRLWVNDASTRKERERRNGQTRFGTQTKSLAEAGWISEAQKSEFDRAYLARNDIAHEALKGLGTLVWEPSRFEQMMATVPAERRLPTPEDFDYENAALARRSAYAAALHVAKRRGDKGNLAGMFTRQSVMFSQIDEMIAAELEIIEREWLAS